MKERGFLFFLVFFSINASSQILEGNWEGTFKYEGTNYPMKITFSFNADNTYDVRSSSEVLADDGNKYLTEAKIYFEMLSIDSVYLKESVSIGSKISIPLCTQEMFLRIKDERSSLVLEGNWWSNLCRLGGTLRLRKLD